MPGTDRQNKNCHCQGTAPPSLHLPSATRVSPPPATALEEAPRIGRRTKRAALLGTPASRCSGCREPLREQSLNLHPRPSQWLSPSLAREPPPAAGPAELARSARHTLRLCCASKPKELLPRTRSVLGAVRTRRREASVTNSPAGGFYGAQSQADTEAPSAPAESTAGAFLPASPQHVPERTGKRGGGRGWGEAAARAKRRSREECENSPSREETPRSDSVPRTTAKQTESK